jgi:hypothetical protein
MQNSKNRMGDGATWRTKYVEDHQASSLIFPSLQPHIWSFLRALEHNEADQA